MFNPGKLGRGPRRPKDPETGKPVGDGNRVSKGWTITPVTYALMTERMEIPSGRGGYVSPLVEIGLLLMAYFAGGEVDAHDLADKMKWVIRRKGIFARRLMDLQNALFEDELLERLRANGQGESEAEVVPE